MKVHCQRAVDWRLVADQTKRAVTVREGLHALGWRVRSRGRAECGLCQGRSRETIAFNDGKGLWRCHRCGAGGDVIALVQQAMKLDFIPALKFLAEVGHVHLPERMTPEERRRFGQQEALHKRASSAAMKMEALERGLRLSYRDLIYYCERRQVEVVARLAALHSGAEQRHAGELDGCWCWLAALWALLGDLVIAYSLLSFGNARNRAIFTLKPEVREEMIARVRWTVGFTNDKGHFITVEAPS